jgi:CBS domain-containing protein
MITVKSLLKFKGSDVWSANPQTSVLEALLLLKEKDVGALLVLDGDRIAGIISERDLVRMMAREGACDLSKPIKEYMTTTVVSISPDHTINDCMDLMTRKHIRHLPVLENGRLVGLISIGDVVREIITNQEIQITNLENYIEGRGYMR